MHKHLIESVRALADAQKRGVRIERVSNLGAGQIFVSKVLLDFPALLAALERAERIESAAFECGAALSMIARCHCSNGGGFACTKCKAIKALGAALGKEPQ